MSKSRVFILMVASVVLSSVAVADGYEPVGKGFAAPPITWTGFYVGINGGLGAFTGTAMDWDDDALASPDGDINLDAFAGIVGVQVGYNHQVGNIVYGAEADFNWTGFDEDRGFWQRQPTWADGIR